LLACVAYCVYGDSKAPFDDGTTCETKLATSPGLCYHDHYNATCCYTCQQIRSQHSSGLSACLSVCLSPAVVVSMSDTLVSGWGNSPSYPYSCLCTLSNFCWLFVLWIYFIAFQL